MQYADSKSTRGARPERDLAPRPYRREIDCAPMHGASRPADAGTGRGRGTPDPERWPREPRRDEA